MPINIYEEKEDTANIARLCSDDWNLRSQIDELEEWLADTVRELPAGNYIADVGFMWRRDARGGGAALSTIAMRQMSDAGIHLHLSEYPGFLEDLV